MKDKGLGIDRIHHSLIASSCQNALANRLPYLVNHETYSPVTDAVPFTEKRASSFLLCDKHHMDYRYI